jgi:NADPH:quinone reductase-like Zn-dependent oxidoreductase
MRAVVIREHGGPETLVVSAHPDPVAGPGEALVRVRACALNHLDTWVRRGVPGHRFPLPLVPGSEVSGVLEAGAVEGLRPGDEVVVAPFTTCERCDACGRGDDVACREYRILGESRDGGCAERVAVPATSVFPKPANLSHVEAASLLLAPLTAWHMLAARAGLKAGERVLVFAAAGGVGTAAVQLASRLGARVTGVVGSPAKREAVLGLGAADVVVAPPGASFETVLREALGRPSFDVVLDSIGGPAFEAGAGLLRPHGRLVTCGATASATASINLRRLFFLSLSLLGSTMGNRSDLREVLRMAASGDLRPVVHAVLPLDRLGDGHRMLQEREVVGKVVVEV